MVAPAARRQLPHRVTLTEASSYLCSFPTYSRNSYTGPAPIQGAGTEPEGPSVKSVSGLPSTARYTCAQERSPVSHVILVVPQPGPPATGFGRASIFPLAPGCSDEHAAANTS